MNKAVKIILNILIVIASIGFFLSGMLLLSSIGSAGEEKEDLAATYAGVMDYEIEHRAYGEILSSYFVKKMSCFDAPEGYENLYKVGEYAHTAFMIRVYEEKGDSDMVSLYKEKAENIRDGLGSYKFTADEVDGMLESSK